jgi:hypothetical protein
MKKQYCIIAAVLLGFFSSVSFASTVSFWANGGTVEGADTPAFLRQNDTKSFSIAYTLGSNWTNISANLLVKAVDDGGWGHCSYPCTDGFYNDGSEKAKIVKIEGTQVGLGPIEINSYGYYNFGDITAYLLNGSTPLSAKVKAAVGDFWYKNARLDISYDIKAVPVPAALWLFGSALLGLTGLRRKSGDVAKVA